MFPDPTELFLVGYVIESIWTPKSKSNTLTPKTNSHDMLTKGNFSRDERHHLLCLFNISHFSSAECSEVVSKRTRIRSRKSHGKVETIDESGRAMQWKGSNRAIFYCIRKPGENLTRKSISARKLSSITGRRNTLYTHIHHAAQNGTLMKLCLLKSGDLL